MKTEYVLLQMCVVLLGLWRSSILATGAWYPKTLPCDVTLVSNRSEVTVDCTERGLTSVPKGIPGNTTNLTLTINHIPKINSSSFQGLENLTEIDMRCNCVPIKIGPKDRICTTSVTIENDTFKGLRNLKALYLDGNQLYSIPKGLPPNLILLSLEVNHIHSILKENLSDISNVQILYLGQNCYYRNPCNVSYEVEEGAFLQLSNLTLLSLKSNNLSYIPPKLPSSLRELYLYNNKIEMVTNEDFRNLTELEILDLSGNCPRCYNAPFPCVPCPDNSPLQIDENAFKTLTKLRILRLHSNSLTYVPKQWFQSCTELRVLDLSTNFLARQITCANFPEALPNLEELDLSFNYELQRYPATLNLSHAFSYLKSLKVLRLRGFVFQQLTFRDIKPLISLENLEVIDLGTNFIKMTNLTILMQLKSFRMIILSDNKISSPSDGLNTVGFSGGETLHGSPMSGANLYQTREVREIHYFRYDEYARSCKYKDKEVGTVNSFVSSQCSQFGKTLDISRNNIFFLHSSFLNLGDLRCLNLSGNAMSQSLNGSEFTYLTKLQYLDFSYNRLDLLYSSAFQELRNLVILDISHNNHYFESEGLTHMLNFTIHLPNLKILLMNYNKISTSTNTQLESLSLEKLEFKGNRLDMLWRDGDLRYVNYFRKLLNLTILDISGNNLNFIPQQVFRGLPDKLTELYINNNKLKSFSWEKLKILQSLLVLDLGRNKLKTVPQLANCTKSLQKLLLCKNQISKLSQYFLKDAFSLKYLDLSFNNIQYIEQSSFPDNVVNHMDMLVLNNNRFLCTCSAIWFVMWINNTVVNIPRLATDVTCAAPGAQRGKPVISVDMQACQYHFLSIFLYILLTSLVLSFVTLSISSHLFLWDVWYIYHFCLAKIKGYGRLSLQSTTYDAFVVYDKTDPEVVEWVLQELRVNLEDHEDHHLQLCLEERDWIPGCPLIDNLSQSIHQSKRTVFILTNKYIRSGNFKTAFYMANQRLMDEKDDVIILIFLEKAATTFWFKLALLFLFYTMVQPAACAWLSRQFPCDVQVNITNTTDDIIFNCQGRQLKVVPDGITGNATVLDLSENQILNVSLGAFSNLVNLTLLNLNWLNRDHHPVYISQGAFTNLTNLQELRLNGNGLTEVPKNLPPRLQILKLDNNKIIVLKNNLSSILHVKELFLSKNCFYWNPCGESFTIGNDIFSALTKLQVLTLASNNLTQVPKGLPNSIQTLDLGSNKIQYISEDDFRELTQLRTLILQGNCPRCKTAPFPCVPCPNVSLEIHPRAFSSLNQLTELHLAGNSLRIIKSSLFTKLTNLKNLFLSWNFLSNAIAEGGFLRYLPCLERIDLSFNYDFNVYPETLKLSRYFSSLVSLRTLHIEGFVFREIHSDTLKPLRDLRNLSTLNLGTNFIVHSNTTIFSKFTHLKLIYLAENRLSPVSVAGSPSRGSQRNLRSVLDTLSLTGFHPKDFSYELSHRLVMPECFQSGRVLVLSSNNLFFISPKQFEGYGDIACLNLSKNGFASAPNGTEFTTLPDLKYLDLSYNKIDLAYDNAFKELVKLEVLDLSYNPHYFELSGVTHNLNFLRNLPALRVLNMSRNFIFTLTTKMMRSTSLKELQFRSNNLGTLWKERDKTYYSLFEHLENLTFLDISFNNIEKIPIRVYKKLPNNLERLHISHNSLTDFQWDELVHFKQLNVLDLSYNYLHHVSVNISYTIQMLDLSHNHISQLSNGFLRGAKSLHNLDLSYNKLSIINQTTFLSGPDNYMKTLRLQGNPFQCTCNLLEFILWIENNDVEIPRLTSDVTCNMPENTRGQEVIFFDIKECINDNEALIFYFLSTSIVIFTMLMAIATHLFYWDASYILYYLKAKLKGYHSLRSTDSVYDAFITYDTRDPWVSDWVLNHMRVQLEEMGETHRPLCLEERDWTPGVPLIDNLSQSIQQSRKTVFVLTEAYVRTGAFRLAVYLAHQRLLDENIDVIVLLLLEPVLQHSHFLRLRRRLCGKSILEWPRTAAAEPWFWQHLKNAVRVDNQVMYSKMYSRYFPDK